MTDAVTPDGSEQLHSSLREISVNLTHDAQCTIPSRSTTAPRQVLVIGGHLHQDGMTEHPIGFDQSPQVQQYSSERLGRSHEV